MVQTVTVAELLGARVTFSANEAVAIAQKLIHGVHAASTHPPFGPPTPETVAIDESGAVWCSACDATPAVSELAILLEAMLPEGARAPGSLRYTIARALLNVDVRPFDSVLEFSRALARFEHGDRDEVVRAVFERWRALQSMQDPPSIVPFKTAASSAARNRGERRRPIPPAIATELRRELRRADVERYQWLMTSLLDRRNAARRRSRAMVATGIGAGLMLMASGELMYRQSANRDQTTIASSPAPAPPAQITKASTSKSVTPPQETPEPRPPGRNAVPIAAPKARARPGPRRNRREDGPRPETTQAVLSTPSTAPPAFDFAGTPSIVQSSTSRPSVLLTPEAGGQLQVMTVSEDGAKSLHAQPAPDGQHVAFDSDRDGERGVYIADRDGSHVRRVSGAGYAAMPTWSPDSRWITYMRRERSSGQPWNLWLLSLDSGNERRLTNYRSGQTWSASWFPDGHRIAYTHDGALLVLDFQTHRTQKFQAPIAGRALRMPAVSPNGRYVLFQVDRHGVWLVDLDDGSMRCALADPTAEQFVWAADGRRFAFHSRQTGEWGVWIMAPA
jgi:WD40 repeat protein